MTIESIRNGFANLGEAKQYEGLKHAAFLRQEADWLIGLNATRCQTIVARSLGAKETLSLGRVQTPVLALIVKRDLLIENFQSVTSWAIAADFKTQNSNVFRAHLVDENKQLKTFESRTEAEALTEQLARSATAPFIQILDRKKVQVKQPLLFDLTSLQREMNKKTGWTAAKTLETAQSLYEKKLTTYPRTSSAYLSASVNDTDVPKILGKLKTAPDTENSTFGRFARRIVENGWKLTTRHVNDEKVTDHHAIIPTGDLPNAGMSKDESELYQAITARFLVAFYPAGVDEKTEIIVNFDNRLFLARGKKIVEKGWREIEGKSEELETENKPEVPEQEIIVEETDSLTKDKIGASEKKTKPPARYTDDTILSAMETAGKIIEDEEARQAMKTLGIGTPATRAEIIEKLIRINYIERRKKALLSTEKGRAVIALLGDNILTSAELTGKWEAALNRVAENTLAPERFRQGVRALTGETVTFISQQSGGNVRFEEANVGNCPKCAVAGRTGKLKGIKARDKKPYLVCTSGREVCNFICAYPRKRPYITKLVSAHCPKCKNSMTYRKSKNEVSFLSCSQHPNCDGIIWLDQKAKTSAAK